MTKTLYLWTAMLATAAGIALYPLRPAPSSAPQADTEASQWEETRAALLVAAKAPRPSDAYAVAEPLTEALPDLGFPVPSQAYELSQPSPKPTALLDERWNAERQEGRWSDFRASMHGVVAGAFTSDQARGSQLLHMECRTTLCRTEVLLAEPPMATFIALGSLVQQDALMASVHGRYRLEGNRAVIYTAPPGVALEPQGQAAP